MRLDLFEALAPVCPRCLHQDGLEAPLVIAERVEMREGRLWHGILHCSNRGCWREFPVIDGVPIITTDPQATIKMAEAALTRRDDLPSMLQGMIGDALGPGTAYDTERQHLSIYAGSHFADWCDSPDGDPAVGSSVAATARAALATMPPAPDGPVLDLGGGPGRAAWEAATTLVRPALVADLNVNFLRLGQRLACEGRAQFGRRRIGLVYDPVEVRLPKTLADTQIDFWALDAGALPFRTGCFAVTLALNLVDCVSAATAVIAETARVAAPGGAAAFSTPYDWSAAVPEIAGWLGGHSQRGQTAGAGEPILTATLTREGLKPVAEKADLPWDLRLHDRASMRYRVHLVTCRRDGP